MKITVDTRGIDAIKARLRGLSENKIKVAAVAALNDAAYLGSKKTQEEMGKVFDRPTPWVMGGVRYIKARKDKLESVIDFEKWGNKTNVTVEKVLAAEIFGGQRKHKRHEIALQKAGILPTGMYIVPSTSVKLDGYGNIPSSLIVQIISWFSAFGEQGYRANATAATRAKKAKGTKKSYGFEFFVVAQGQKRTWSRAGGGTGSHKMQPGIYIRTHLGHGSAIKPVLIFVSRANYKKRLDFYAIAEKAAIAEFNRAFPRYLKQLLDERGL